jgi:hypothetical protein
VRAILACLTPCVATGAILGLLAVGGPAFAQAKPIEPQVNSLQNAIDGFVAYLRSETYDLAAEAGRMARDHREAVDAPDSTLRAYLDEFGAALSGQKERAETLARDALARLDAWSKSAGVSWAEARRQAEQLFDGFSTWLRSQTPSDAMSEIPV